MRVMITGASGFAGRHLSARLARRQDLEIIGISSRKRPPIEGVRLLVCDLRDSDLTRRVLERYQPEIIYHLAGQTYVPQAFASPAETLISNVIGQINLFEGCRAAHIDPVIVAVTSAEIYGEVGGSDVPIEEEQPLNPMNPYASSKAAQDLYAGQYYSSYGMKIVRARPFNHIGPGQSDRFVVASFARQIAEAEVGIAEPVLLVGNLDPVRDFLDVRDVVHAYEMIARAEFGGEAFNIASGVGISIKGMLDMLLSEARCQIEVRKDPERVRPADVPVFRGDSTKLRNATGWRPECTLEDAVRDVLEDWRARVGRRRRPNT
jgi:GDP-4-dehydro-6-deoxy-D-mannose reductase